MPFYGCHMLALVAFTRGDLSFIAVGDWGGLSDEQPTTRSQELTSAGIQSVAEDLGSNFTVLLGDNFYPHGIACSAESSSRFREGFREVYANKMPGSIFYVLAGNHDYGEGAQANVSAQLEYSKLDSQWHFPALWYKIHREFTAGAQKRTVDILLIDSIILCYHGHNDIFIDKELRFMWPRFDNLQSTKLRYVLAEKQWAWLEQELNSSTADFLLVAGHFPIWSVGWHGASTCLIDRLLPMLTKYNAHYISGHDHMSAHFQHHGFNNFVLGAGNQCCYRVVQREHIPRGALKYVLAGNGGNLSSQPVPFPVQGSFGSFRFTAEYATATIHAHDGHELYTAPAIPRRSAHASLHLLELHSWPLWIAVPAMASSLSVAFFAIYCQHRLKTYRSRGRLTEALLEN